MRRINLSKLRLFYTVAQEGNLTRASEKLHMTQPALSKSLTEFEDRLKTKLFDRLRHGMRLTDQGERLYIYAKKVLEEQDIFERYFYDNKDVLAGELKITTYPFVGAEWLVPNLKGFIKSYPDIDIRIHLESENLKLFEADVIMSTFIPHHPHLIQKPLFAARTHLFASKEYLKKYGKPTKAEDLDGHRLITYRGNFYSTDRSINIVINTGRKSSESPRKSCLEIDSLYGMINSAREGYGIVELPNYPLVLNAGLEIILPEVRGEEIMLYYIFEENRKNSKKINNLYEHLIKQIK